MPRGERHSREQGRWEQSSKRGDRRCIGNITTWVWLMLKRRWEKECVGGKDVRMIYSRLCRVSIQS